jgi:hypothetical protein
MQHHVIHTPHPITCSSFDTSQQDQLQRLSTTAPQAHQTSQDRRPTESSHRRQQDGRRDLRASGLITGNFDQSSRSFGCDSRRDIPGQHLPRPLTLTAVHDVLNCHSRRRRRRFRPSTAPFKDQLRRLNIPGQRLLQNAPNNLTQLFNRDSFQQRLPIARDCRRCRIPGTAPVPHHKLPQRITLVHF